jgi:hypothetical protein
MYLGHRLLAVSRQQFLLHGVSRLTSARLLHFAPPQEAMLRYVVLGLLVVVVISMMVSSCLRVLVPVIASIAG